MNKLDRKKADSQAPDCPYRHIKRDAVRLMPDGKAYIGTTLITPCSDQDTLDVSRQKCVHCINAFPIERHGVIHLLNSRIGAFFGRNKSN